MCLTWGRLFNAISLLYFDGFVLEAACVKPGIKTWRIKTISPWTTLVPLNSNEKFRFVAYVHLLYIVYGVHICIIVKSLRSILKIINCKWPCHLESCSVIDQYTNWITFDHDLCGFFSQLEMHKKRIKIFFLFFFYFIWFFFLFFLASLAEKTFSIIFLSLIWNDFGNNINFSVINNFLYIIFAWFSIFLFLLIKAT